MRGTLDDFAVRVRDKYADEIERSEPIKQTMLALSGGGADGAFGAGLLKGWTASGKRPVFSTVTGVSTGAIIALFAFLDHEYDHKLEEIYTEYQTSELLETAFYLYVGRNHCLDNHSHRKS